MLLPDNIQPELSIYYNGAVLLEQLNKVREQPIMDLYENIKNTNDMSFSVFIMSLDWLYLIDVARINDEGVVKLCS